MPDAIDTSTGGRRGETSSGRDDGHPRIYCVVLRVVEARGGMESGGMAKCAEVQGDQYADSGAVQSADGLVRWRHIQ
jgi:hypothetical protein